MKIMVLDRQVQQNLARFKHLIQRAGQKGKEVVQTAKKGIKAYLNTKTGEIKFADLKKEKHPSSKWKAIVIQLHPSQEGAFEVLTPDQKNVFDCSELTQAAYTRLANTAHTLNQLAYDPKHIKDNFWILRQIAATDFIFNEEDEGERNLIYNAWHDVDRLEAENLLRDAEAGTYLFRKDEFAKDLEQNLGESLDIPISCITLNYCKKEGKIAEKTIVYKDGKWLFYDDDPNLSSHGFENVKELLATLGNKLERPLLFNRS